MSEPLPRWEDSVPCEVYKPLYPPEGGPVSGYQCMECPATKRAVTRTRRGILIHLAVVHGVTLQKEFTFQGEVCKSVDAGTQDSRDLSTDVGATGSGARTTTKSG